MADRLRLGAPRTHSASAKPRQISSAHLVDADQVAGGIAEGAVAYPVRLLDRLLDVGWSAGPIVIQRIPPYPTSLRSEGMLGRGWLFF